MNTLMTMKKPDAQGVVHQFPVRSQWRRPPWIEDVKQHRGGNNEQQGNGHGHVRSLGSA
jgi:hypothetical protein